jgi:hypothetical protein
VKNPQKLATVVTTDEGKFQFTDVPGGKYALEGSKKAFVTAGYEQHESYSTAIVTGAGLDTENLILKLPPTAVLSGKVLDEDGDPVRHATITLYYSDHLEGVDQIRVHRREQTDDLGNYELPSLMPGTYFLSASATPWYAIHPRPDTGTPKTNADEEQGSRVDRALDVAYPTTYYADTTDTDSASAIPVKGGEHLQVDIHLSPVPALRITFHAPSDEKGAFLFPRLEQPAFDGSTFVPTATVGTKSPGVFELIGVPAGRYNVRMQGPSASFQMDAVDLTKDGEDIDTSKAESASTVKVSVKLLGDSIIPDQLKIGLVGKNRMIESSTKLDSKGEGVFLNVSPGRYRVVNFGVPRLYAVLSLSAEGADLVGRRLIVKPGSSASLSVTLTSGTAEIEGVAKLASKPLAGAMIVLIPKDAEGSTDLFHRDQSDLDGTFVLRGVIPGSYTIVAIENGWDLDWSQPAFLAAYAKKGRAIDVSGQNGKPVVLPEPIEVQQK